MTDEEKRPQHCEKELAQFIRSGATRRPEQAFGDYYRGRHASCALGAAYEGMYRLPEQAANIRPTKDLEWFFDCLEGSVRKCPGGDGCKKSLEPGGDPRAPERRPQVVARADRELAG